jgi:hypothetical protein
MEPETSLPYSQVSATCPYPEPAPSSPHNPLSLPEEIRVTSGPKTAANHAAFIALSEGYYHCDTLRS